MTRARRTGAALATLVAVALTGGACSGGSTGTPTVQNATNVGENQIRSVPYDQVKQGGNLNYPLSAKIGQFNTNELDGNTLDASNVMQALMPSLFVTDAGGGFHYNPDYLTGEPTVATGGGRQVVTYRINPAARWADGTQISASDFLAQWTALNGRNPAYKPVSTAGYDDITSVVPGANAQEVVVSFDRPYGEWRSLFSLLYPASTNGDPTVFNTGWVDKPLTTAGPFVFASQDTGAQTYTVKANTGWWGRKPKLDTITFRAIDPSSQAAALNDNDIDFIDVGPDASTYAQVQGFAGVDIREAGGPNFRQLTMNGSSPELTDVNTRQGLAMAIDRTAIAREMLSPLGIDNPTALGNHLYMANQAGYQDNSGTVGRYDPVAAAQKLTAAGWVVSGTHRVNNGLVPATAANKGKTLKINFVVPSNVPVSFTEAKLIQDQLDQVQVEVDINSVDINHYFDQYVATGQFDFIVFAYIGSSYPISGSAGLYRDQVDGVWNANFSRVGSTVVDQLLNTAEQQLDPAQAIKAANTADRAIWDEATVLPTYQRPDIWAVRTNLVNFGAFGFASPDYTAIGFQQ